MFLIIFLSCVRTNHRPPTVTKMEASTAQRVSVLKVVRDYMCPSPRTRQYNILLSHLHMLYSGQILWAPCLGNEGGWWGALSSVHMYTDMNKCFCGSLYMYNVHVKFTIL